MDDYSWQPILFASYNYHYQQLEWRPNDKEQSAYVRYALLIDYIAAWSSIGLGTFFALTRADLAVPATFDGMIHDPVPQALFVSVTAAVFFFVQAKYGERGKPYLILHSIWHLLSGYAGYLVGSLPTVKAAAMTATTTAVTSTALTATTLQL